MKDFHEIKRTDSTELLQIAAERLKDFPLLSDTYNESFLKELIRNKADATNILLNLLVNGNVNTLFTGLESNLNVFKQTRDYSLLKQKLRVWRKEAFESVITELEYSASYLQRGFSVELEPLLSNGKKGDFCIDNG